MIDHYLRSSLIVRIRYAITDLKYHDIAKNDIPDIDLEIYRDYANQPRNNFTPAFIIVNSDEGVIVIPIYIDISIPNGHITMQLFKFLEEVKCISRSL